MRVRLLKRAAGPMGNWPAGAEVELSEELARALVAGGYAEMLEPPAVEEARVEAPETAVGRRMRKTGRIGR
jgi:hypothetical protein